MLPVLNVSSAGSSTPTAYANKLFNEPSSRQSIIPLPLATGAFSRTVGGLAPTTTYAIRIVLSGAAQSTNGMVVLASTQPAGLSSTVLEFDADFATTFGASFTVADTSEFIGAVYQELQTLGVPTSELTTFNIYAGSIVVTVTGLTPAVDFVSFLAVNGFIVVDFRGTNYYLVTQSATVSPGTSSLPAYHLT